MMPSNFKGLHTKEIHNIVVFVVTGFIRSVCAKLTTTK